MTFTLRPAVRENLPLIIGIIGGTGSGKTYSALELATGLAGGERFGAIDTESGRMKHYADDFKFDHGDLSAPYRPDAYTEAITATDKAGYPVVVVDSTSHIWAGDGGVLDWQEDELDRIAGKNADYARREACKMAAWIQPKMAHKRFVQKLLGLRCHLILCFRAEPKIEMVKEDNKWKIIPKPTKTGKDGWVPICEKNLPFELTMSFLLTDEAPGVPVPIKLEKDHRPMVPLDAPLSRATGARLAEWAAGRKPAATPAAESASTVEFITPDQCITLEGLCQAAGIAPARLAKAGGVERLSVMRADKYAGAVKWIEDTKRAREQ